MISGLTTGLIEITLFVLVAGLCRNKFKRLLIIKPVTYYWLTFTVLTGIWELNFILHYKDTTSYSDYLVKNDEHVWTNKYPINSILPPYVSKIFYAEYGAYADKEYQLLNNDWSRIIEGTHMAFCGVFSLMALIFHCRKNHLNYQFSIGLAMGTQLINSIIYMGKYFSQMHNPNNVNYCSTDFPCGFMLIERPFMYVNVFWSLMPSLIILQYLISNMNRP